MQENQQIISQLRDALKYDPATGHFIWRIARGRSSIGKAAGTLTTAGYLKVRYSRKEYLLHRVAWAFMHGSWPEAWIDHANGDPLDNRASNLRSATPSQNHANRLRNSRNASGAKGVSRQTVSGKYEADLRVGKKHIRLGTFATAEEAKAAFVAAHATVFGEFSAPYYVGEARP